MGLKLGLKKELKQIKNSGIYLLELYSPKNFRIDHKNFSSILFPSGYYYYVGSAQRNLIARVERHFKKKKKIHWHIDQLTTLENITIKNVFIIPKKSKNFECELVKDLLNIENLSLSVKNFGNSDCSNCESHLLYSADSLSYSHLCSLYQSTVLFIPSSKDIC